MRFDIIKCHGSGNDFPMIDARALSIDEATWAGVARALADRAGPVGGDGLLLLTAGDADHSFGMVMYNSDGSQAETCLNGLRCVARAGFEALGIDRARVRLKTSSAEVVLDAPLAPGVVTVRETAGPADRDVARWPMVGGSRLVEQAVPQLPTTRLFTAIAMPNPHLVSFVDMVDDDELSAIGKMCEAAPDWLPNRANVSFVELGAQEASGDLFVRTFERGVGLTASCGSAMAASIVAACLTGRADYGRMTTIRNQGGMVRGAAERDFMVTLLGNATYEWAGSVTVDAAKSRATDLIVRVRHEAEVAAWGSVLGSL